MRKIWSAVLYTALALAANPVLADIDGAKALREGTMKKLIFHPAPKPVSEIPFQTPDGTEKTLADYKGKVVVLNFWATWCAPCRKEMPALDRLQAEFGGENFEVVTIATGRNAVPGIRKFFEEVDVTNLPILLDPRQTLAREMSVLGLPITLILNPEGEEIARLLGDAEWDGESAKAIVAALLASS